VIDRLHQSLPGNDVWTLERMGLTRRGLRAQLAQLDAMYTSTRDTDAEMAHQALEAAIRYNTETAVAFGRQLITLASTAARGASTVQIDALAQQAFVKGYNCPTMIPELRKTRRSLGDDCQMKDMMKIAEQTEADYSINRDRADDRQKQPPKRDQKQVRLVTPTIAAVAPARPGTTTETRQSPDDRPIPGWVQCHKYGGYGHVRRMCMSDIVLQLEPWRKRDAAQQDPTQAGVVASLASTLPVVTQATVQPQTAAATQSNPRHSSRVISLRRNTEVENAIRKDNLRKNHPEIQDLLTTKEVLEDKNKLPVWY
jgi:hypothetical protein